MLTPEELSKVASIMQASFDELNEWIITDMIIRIVTRFYRDNMFVATGSDEWQALVLKETGGHYEDIKKQLKKYTAVTDEQIKEIFEDVGIKSWDNETEFYTEKGIEQPGSSLLDHPEMVEILTDIYQRTKGECHNLTNTTAMDSENKLIDILDQAHLQVTTGATSLDEAVSEAIEEVSEYQAEVTYPSGYIDTVENAVTRAVRTGTAQASGNISLERLKQNGWDLVRVSSHLGARYGDGGKNPGNHHYWQGGLYSLSGNDPKYPPFIETTGYGTGEGLSGWNCRHSFGAGSEDFDPTCKYGWQENKEAYDNRQKAKSYERRIKHLKNKVTAYKTAMQSLEKGTPLYKEYADKYHAYNAKLKQVRAEYKAFKATHKIV